MTTFKDIRQEIYEDGQVFGSTELFGEAATYDPKDGPARTVNGRGVYAKDEDVVFGGVVTAESEILWWSCCKDPACNAGGIDRPQLGETLVREGVDQPNTPWAFAGQIRNEKAGGWQLLFQRNRVRRYGPTP